MASPAPDPFHRFQGRRAVLTELVSWLDAPAADRRVLLVTGSPGVGKSAVLGRIVTTADTSRRAAPSSADTAVRATPGSVHCAVHAGSKNALEVAHEIARAASARLPHRVEDLAPAVAEALTDRPRRFNIVIDALDEAATPAEARRIATGLLLPLVQTCPDVRAVVGTRRHDDDGDLPRAFGPAAVTLDLDDPSLFSPDDLTAHALAVLRLRGAEHEAGPYADEAIARPVAAAIAARAGRNFLVAGLVARCHGRYDTVPADPAALSFTGTVAEALRAFLLRIPSPPGGTATALLTALAFAEAPGFTLELWRTAVHTLYGTAPALPELADFARSSAADLLVESGGTDGTRLYRLFHHALGDALLADRADQIPHRADQRALTSAFLALGTARSWRHAPGYLLRSLSTHAALAESLPALLADPLYLAHADLPRLLSSAARTGHLDDRVRLLRLTPRAHTASPAERIAMFSVAEAVENLATAFRHRPPLSPDSPPPYRAAWASTVPRAERAVLDAPTDGVQAVCALPRPDGTALLATGGADGIVRIWDPETATTLRILTGHTDRVNAVCALPRPDGTAFLATAGDDETVRIWDPDTATTLHTLTGHTDGVRAVCALPRPDGSTFLATGGDDETVRIWDPDTTTLHTLTGHTSEVWAVCALPRPDGTTLLATAGDDETVRIWDPDTTTTLHTLTGHTDGVTTVCALPRPDGTTLLATGSDDETVRIWDPDTSTVLHTLTGHTHRVNAVCALPRPDGTALLAIAVSIGETVRIWDPDTATTLHTLTGHTSEVWAVCALPRPDGTTLLATAGDDETVRIWDPDTTTAPRPFTGHADWVTAVCALPQPDGTALLATGSHDATVRIWDPDTGTALHTLTGHTSEVWAVCALPRPDGTTLLATAGDDETVRIWDPDTTTTLHTLTGHRRGVSAVCALPRPDGAILLATADRNGVVRIWDPETTTALHTLTGHTSGVRAVCALPRSDGTTLLATGSHDATVRIWDPDTAATLHTLTGHASAVNAVCALPRPDGTTLLVTAAHNGIVRIWDPETATALHFLTGHTGGVQAVCALPRPDGTALLATAGNDETVRIWDPVKGETLMVVPVHHMAWGLAFVNGLLAVVLNAGVLLIRLDPG